MNRVRLKRPAAAPAKCRASTARREKVDVVGAAGSSVEPLQSGKVKDPPVALETDSSESAKEESLRDSLFYYGFDIGGTKMQFSVFNAALVPLAGEAFEKRQPTPDDYDGFLRYLAECVSGADQALGMSTAPIGLSFPGAPSQNEEDRGRMVCVNVKAVNGRFLQRDLLEKFHGRMNTTVMISNDATCFALSEALAPDLCESECVLGVIIGSGVGGGVVVNGRPLNGLSNFAGEFGHYPIPHQAWERLGCPEKKEGECPCGQRWCVERFLSGVSMERRYKDKYSEQLSAIEIFQRYENGEPNAREHVEEFLDVLAQCLQVLLVNFDPRAIVFGGGISNWDGLFKAEGIRSRLKKLLLPSARLPEISKHRFGDSGGARGAAVLNARAARDH